MDSELLTVIIPVLNESSRATALLSHINTLPCRVIVVDGNSGDGTRDRISTGSGPRVLVIESAQGRARQMNAGAARATTPYLLFLHADTELPEQAAELVVSALQGSNRRWGRFDVSFDSSDWLLRVVAYMMNWRSALTGICTGDQAIFVTARDFYGCGGFADIPLMEDIELSARLRLITRPLRLRSPVTTAARRWSSNGPLRTIVQMWSLRLRYWLGQPPESLARRYTHAR